MLTVFHLSIYHFLQFRKCFVANIVFSAKCYVFIDFPWGKWYDNTEFR